MPPAALRKSSGPTGQISRIFDNSKPERSQHSSLNPDGAWIRITKKALKGSSSKAQGASPGN
jgi:hypothetical protein